jgi:hypothetical protein
MGAKRDNERVLFESFLKVQPEFAGEPLSAWEQPNDERDFPDIIGTSVTGKKIGVEIGEWLNEEEIQAAKKKERTEEEFLNAIGDQGPNPTRHIRYIWLRPKKGILAKDASAFREQLFACVLECDKRWPNERFWKGGHRLVGGELAPYPMLAKYLEDITLKPANPEQSKENWITFRARVDIFDAETMQGPLRELVDAKIGHYATANTGFDDLSLLIIYNRAAIYNSPAETFLHTYEDAVTRVKQAIGERRGPFHRAFLYIALKPGEQVFRVF